MDSEFVTRRTAEIWMRQQFWFGASCGALFMTAFVVILALIG
jgi:hypothetical protein